MCVCVCVYVRVCGLQLSSFPAEHVYGFPLAIKLSLTFKKMHAVYIRASVRGKKQILNWVVVYLTLFIMCGIIVLKLTSLLVNYFKIIMVFRNNDKAQSI